MWMESQKKYLGDGGNVDTIRVKKLELCSQRSLIKVNININEKSSYNKEIKDATEEMTPANQFHIKEISEIFHNIESAKDKM